MHRVLALTSALLLGAALSAAGEAPAEAGPVLDLERGSFRVFMAWKTPTMVSTEGKLVPLLEPARKGLKEEDRKPFPVHESARPPKDWAAPEFDDSSWPRVHGQAVVIQRVMIGSIYSPGNPADWNLVCLRGKFRVSDPAQVKDLKLSLRYHGGAAVYVNGVELHRGHLPAGELKPETLADKYGEEAYVRPDGKLYCGGDGATDWKDFAERIATRVRTIPPKDAPDGVAIPGKMLRKGINVLAVEVRTAPVSTLSVERTPAKVNWQGALSPWPHAGALEARLTSASGAGLTPNVAPGAGIEIAASQPIETVAAWDYTHPAEKPGTIRLVGARNGFFSGKAVLSSAAAIKGLKASMSDLALDGGTGKIPASAVAVRWAEPVDPKVSWNSSERFDRLLEAMPAEVAPRSVRLRGERKWQPAPAAVAPVWVTVKIPADAAPGEYKGTLTVEAQGAPNGKFAVPVALKVHDWAVPDPKDFEQRYNLYQSADTLAQYYQVPLWSDKHWELIGKSFEVMRQAGNKLCLLHLVAKVPSLNNTESMVRWVRKKPVSGVSGQVSGTEKKEGDPGTDTRNPTPDTFEYDFTIAEKYMDLYEKICGKPAILELFIWEHHAKTDKKPPTPKPVTLVDPATGKTEELTQPPYDTSENEAFWKPMMTELKKRLEKRGWYDVAAVCYTSYCWGPSKEQVDIYKNIWPDGKWMNCSHSNPASYAGTQGSMPVPFSEWVWGCGGLYNPDGGKGGHRYPRPWKKGTARIEVGNPRYGVGVVNRIDDGSPLVLCRTVAEAALQGGIRGLGRVGGDFWPVPVGKGNRLGSICDSYAAVGPTNNTRALTSPGPEGAIFNERLEMFREGVQLAEAIVYLQKALEAKSVSAELAGKIEELLDERARYYLRTRVNQGCNWLAFECSDWQGRDDRLLGLCAEVAKATKGK